MKKLSFKKIKLNAKFFSILVGVIILVPLSVFAVFNLYYSGKIFPGITVASMPVGGLSVNQAPELLSQKVVVPKTISLSSESQGFNLETKEISLAYDFSKSANNAFNLTRTGDIISDWVLEIDNLLHPKNLELVTQYDEEELKKFISVLSGQLSTPAQSPSISIKRPSVTINKGTKGTEVNQDLLIEKIKQNLVFASDSQIQIPIDHIDSTINDDEAEALKERAENLLGKSLSLTFEFNNFEITDSQILSFLGPKGGLDEGKIEENLKKISSQINREPQSPKFTFDAGRVTEFQPALDGVEVDLNKLKTDVINQLDRLEKEDVKNIKISVPTFNTPPGVTTESVNNLGIRQLIGRGSSRFRGSIASRVHNIQLASSRLNGLLINPGETFSFNSALGDVSKFTGYQEAYVIREGKTILGDGGGVCQVSTTFFRAALNAGLPILERQAHAYRVGYYEQDSPPGLDATVYGPSPDLKIKNDTPAHILIQAKADTKSYSLVFELYGTSDGRVATTSKPVTTNVTPPGEDLYVDDPTLPAGTVKQTEHKANGARVTFTYRVERGGEEIYKKTFISNYRPWQAVYLRGTAPAI